MLGIIFRRYPDRALKAKAQTRDIETAIELAMQHRSAHGCRLREFPARPESAVEG